MNTQNSTQVRWSIRLFDSAVAALALLICLPFILGVCVFRKLQAQSVFERVYVHGAQGQVGLWQFAYQGAGYRLPQVLNLIKGDIGLLGAEAQFAIEPLIHAPEETRISRIGIFSISAMQRRMGIEFESSEQSLVNAYSNLSRYLLALASAILNRLMTSESRSHASQVTIFGVTMRNLSMNQMLDMLVQQAQRTKHHLTPFAFVNADCLNKAYCDPQYHQKLNECEAVFADGIGVRMACRWQGVDLKGNLNGTDMLPLLCERLIEANLSLYLLGGAPEVAHQAAEQLQRRFPQLQIAGTHHGYFHEADTKQVIKKINQSGAAVLLVAMGAPKQELWLNQYQAKLTPAVGIGVGGLFDFYSNRISRAPLWLRQIGMEWIWRLMQEPKRMWRRYIIGNPLFLYRVYKALRANASLKATTQAVAQSQETLLYPNLSDSGSLKRCKRIRLHLLLNRIVKRCLDIWVAAIAILLLSPLLLIVALLIRLESPGAVLFCQQRVGKWNQPFTMWKFRSMYQDAEARLVSLQQANEMQGGVLFKMKQDPRITRVGQFIRKTSIDELPQLWNVLKGEMSLVGPRPALPREVAQYSPSDRRRLEVKPGITCIWQVSGRSDIPFDRQVELDVDYIYQQSLMADLYLLLKTIPAVIFSRGAY
ncbi:exopolysaccharide biosynthesis polyprenyl glycosylphosphotransferase [Shewanella seohaensis]|uniref:exopolysaccharide biosynthesis polyprenyl glycosylphosphotransferase n=1 Tax=Shewanella seohaensis TaxID=755175 RepID=UPI00200C8CCA|nr:exopolysaccharide biosynthesis polyprenyl glycosylphosphotransferase [Shewanella seohaensis]MCL1121040.1 exopolysaccharide biosynthesis polyprenyl glycosylphosphotransferase [Shewanella seohaensis]UXM80846.1 exopolysaccharide biosynthesis polyprenyl glycosylphosphotransferase [Shewanella seohaensis]